MNLLHRGLLLPTALLAVALSPLIASAQDVRISEFMAVNDGPLTDEDGDYSDWIELHNAGATTVDLLGWYLTDKASDLTQWRFPSTNLPPNGYLIVFASGKNRRDSGAPLHTNFKLSGSGEYLALVRPDGTNIASSYEPVFPPQVGGISYGIPLQQTSITLISSGALARVFVPVDGSLGSNWTKNAFDDSGWLSTHTGIGYETDGQTPFVSTRLADSVAEFSGTQGANNWFYGSWNKSANADGVYADSEFIAFPNSGRFYGSRNFFDAVANQWQWCCDSNNSVSLWSDGGFPNGDDGVAGGPGRGAIRRSF